VTTCENPNLEKILVSQNHATAVYYAGYTPFSTKLSLSKTQNFFYNISTVSEEEFNTLPDSSVYQQLFP
jgi:hypothetical protein